MVNILLLNLLNRYLNHSLHLTTLSQKTVQFVLSEKVMSKKYKVPVDALPEKEWERNKDIPHRFDEIRPPDWVEVKEVIKTQRELEAEHEKIKPKPPKDSEDEFFVASRSKRHHPSPNRPEYNKMANYGHASETTSSMDSVTKGMIGFGLGETPWKHEYHNKFNKIKSNKNHEINFKGKFRENTEPLKTYPKERHPKSLYIPPPDYTDDEAVQGIRSPAQKYYYEKLLLEGIPDLIPRPKLLRRNHRFAYGEEFEYHEEPHVQGYEHDGNVEYVDHYAEIDGTEGYYADEYPPYYDTQYQENVDWYTEDIETSN
ncbi:unnamed protein product [Meganyctiphanes norvegica]|uniref:Uncharacterized protein n=1 Tax=Meganyctiphanes norvegica TaxID=48144 RepID=A0AAV2RAZ5_MEGNR